MIYKNGTDANIERHKSILGITGDVYVVNNHIASLDSHKKVFLESTATTIEEAESEYVQYEKEEEARRLLETENQEEIIEETPDTTSSEEVQ